MLIDLAFGFCEVPFCYLAQVDNIDEEQHRAKDRSLWQSCGQLIYLNEFTKFVLYEFFEIYDVKYSTSVSPTPSQNLRFQMRSCGQSCQSCAMVQHDKEGDFRVIHVQFDSRFHLPKCCSPVVGCFVGWLACCEKSPFDNMATQMVNWCTFIKLRNGKLFTDLKLRKTSSMLSLFSTSLVGPVFYSL